jgi:hypothetical protein
MLVKKLFFPSPGSFAWARERLNENGSLLIPEITVLIKRNFSPDEIKVIVEGLKRSRKPGRPPTHSPAQLDFDPTFRKLLQEYPRVLRSYKEKRAQLRAAAKAAGRTLPRGHYTAFERTIKFLHKKYGVKLRIKEPGTLRNLISKTFHKVPDYPVEHEELEAIWESQQSERSFRQCIDCPYRVQKGSKPGEDAK